jgi:hypothetical protein
MGPPGPPPRHMYQWSRDVGGRVVGGQSGQREKGRMRNLKIFVSLTVLAVVVILSVLIADAGLLSRPPGCSTKCECVRAETVRMSYLGNSVPASAISLDVGRVRP